MKRLYIINNSLFFNEMNNTLSLNGDDENTLYLPPPAGRLLTELIQNVGQLISRDELLVRVWEDHGFRASNSNLNNYLSVLRRNIASLAPEMNIIVTFPKQGVMLDAEITREESVREERIGPEEQFLVSVSNSGDIPNYSHLPPPLTFRNKNKLKKLLIITSLFCMLTSFFLIASNYRQGKNISPQQLFSHEKCNIFSLDSSHIEDNELDNILKKFNVDIDCKNIKHDIFYSHYRNKNKKQNITFISWCQLGKEQEYINCENVKSLGLDIL